MIIAVVEQITGFIYLYINFTGNKNYNVLILTYFLPYKWGEKVIKTFSEKSHE